MDVQVNLEIQGGSVSASRLEHCLQQAGFGPDTRRVWRWKDQTAPAMVVQVEFLADLDDVPNQQVVSFDGCESLGAVNLRGTGFASLDWELRTITAELDEQPTAIELRVATLPAYLLAKIHAAYGRGLTKDWYDIAYVLLHNDEGGPVTAAHRIRERFGDALIGSSVTALGELSANFADAAAQGSAAFVETMIAIHPDLDGDVLANDAVAALAAFIAELRLDAT